jgi:hypothetical protein
MEFPYPAQDPKSLESTRIGRERLFRGDVRARWPHSPAKMLMRKGEPILVIEGFEVMRGFERPYMRELAYSATKRGGRILNVGFGLGYVDRYIEEVRADRGVTEHHIVELNADVFLLAEEWRNQSPHKESVFLHRGDWNDLLPQFQKQGLTFQGIVYDGFPLESSELHRDAVPFLIQTLKRRLVEPRTGLITFYLDSQDGLGDPFQSLLKRLGVSEVSVKKIDVSLPTATQYWNCEYFLLPTLTGIDYLKQEKE